MGDDKSIYWHSLSVDGVPIEGRTRLRVSLAQTQTCQPEIQVWSHSSVLWLVEGRKTHAECRTNKQIKIDVCGFLSVSSPSPTSNVCFSRAISFKRVNTHAHNRGVMSDICVPDFTAGRSHPLPLKGGGSAVCPVKRRGVTECARTCTSARVQYRGAGRERSAERGVWGGEWKELSLGAEYCPIGSPASPLGRYTY